MNKSFSHRYHSSIDEMKFLQIFVNFAMISLIFAHFLYDSDSSEEKRGNCKKTTKKSAKKTTRKAATKKASTTTQPVTNHGEGSIDPRRSWGNA